MFRYDESNFQRSDEKNGYEVYKFCLTHSDLHWHTFYEVEFYISGNGYQLINGIQTELSTGTLCLIRPQDFHMIHSCDGDLEIMKFSFSEYMLSPLVIQQINASPSPLCITLQGEEFKFMLCQYQTLFHEDTICDEVHSIALKNLMNLICIEILRKAMDEQIKDESRGKRKEISELGMLLFYIKNHCEENITREQAANMLHLSPTYFSSYFKKKLGISFNQYLLDCRMTLALQLLQHTEDKIITIMQTIGYHSTSIFYRKFMEYYGISPKEARNQYKIFHKEN